MNRHVADKARSLSAEKVVGYLTQQLRFGHVQPILSLFPEILQHHPELTEDLEAIHQRALDKARMLEASRPAPQAASQVNCAGCGAALPRLDTQAKTLTCHYCGSSMDLAKPEQVIGKSKNINRYPPRSFLRIGMVGELRGNPYKVVGRMVYRGWCREWDSEDDVWEKTRWSYEEWLLLGEDRSFQYLTHDDEGLQLATEFTASKPELPDADARQAPLGESGRIVEVDEHGQYELKHFEGEFGWFPRIDETTRTVEATSGGIARSVEARLDDHNQPAEIEFFAARDVSVKELLTAFDRQAELAELARRETRTRSFLRHCGMALAVSALLFMAIWIVGDNGDVLAEDQFDFRQAKAGQAVLGPFNLSEVGEIYRVDVSASFADNRWAFVGAELLDANRNAINALDGDFWRESGYDEGHWSESKLTAKQTFELSQAGDYFLRLNVETSQPDLPGNINAKIRENVTPGTPFGLASLAALVLGLSLLRFTRTSDLLDYDPGDNQ